MPKNAKTEMRMIMEEWRRELSSEDARIASRAILDQLSNLMNWNEVTNVHCYMPILERHEIDTRQLLQYIWLTFPHIVTSVPIVRSKTMLSCTVTSQTTWQTGKWGMEEPVETSMSTAQKFDVIIVPMLAFNEDGHRIGYGGGYYDKFLAEQKDAVTIGLCYERGLMTFQPEAHDVPLQYVVTETQIRQFA